MLDYAGPTVLRVSTCHACSKKLPVTPVTHGGNLHRNAPDIALISFPGSAPSPYGHFRASDCPTDTIKIGLTTVPILQVRRQRRVRTNTGRTVAVIQQSPYNGRNMIQGLVGRGFRFYSRSGGGPWRRPP